MAYLELLLLRADSKAMAKCASTSLPFYCVYRGPPLHTAIFVRTLLSGIQNVVRIKRGCVQRVSRDASARLVPNTAMSELSGVRNKWGPLYFPTL